MAVVNRIWSQGLLPLFLSRVQVNQYRIDNYFWEETDNHRHVWILISSQTFLTDKNSLWLLLMCIKWFKFKISDKRYEDECTAILKLFVWWFKWYWCIKGGKGLISFRGHIFFCLYFSSQYAWTCLFSTAAYVTFSCWCICLLCKWGIDLYRWVFRISKKLITLMIITF